LIYSVVVAIVGASPTLFGFAGVGYGILAAALGALFLSLAFEVWRKRRGTSAHAAARRLFAFSVLYLFLLFAALLAAGMRGSSWRTRRRTASFFPPSSAAAAASARSCLHLCSRGLRFFSMPSPS